jgi:RimJ/RimL family protein N-acetyltransferase
MRIPTSLRGKEEPRPRWPVFEDDQSARTKNWRVRRIEENEGLTQPLQLETPRLTLRRWQEGDRAAFAEMNADPVVMHFFEAPFTRQQSDETIDRYLAGFDREGFSFFAATLRDTGGFMGTIGMQTMRDVVPNLAQPAVEIGWRLTRAAQGQGLATEGARTIVDFAFNQLGLNEVVAITALPNRASRHVMEKLGMTRRPELDFDHPRVSAGHPYQRQTLYSLRNPNSNEVPCSTPS